ncbi:metal-activated pyridoxal enzyme [Aliidongia dinghuensis]|uniref:Metal-activated pyridoxal enzyme n=1 Tax=Aliidongia dinghuensis TaxID=1867774 RepID=A0A8J2YPL2_9PROT|nr:DSD1 family PLP-dependent enzyme [Aliidongia dinghuensis]GGE99876.1 metal-activated pyridoxal enzyme [Aliidongia dinghuensis]
MTHPNEPLIGVPGGRARLDTPALLIERPALLRNIQRMAEFAAARSVGLRPHSKTHKSVEIARLQVAAGAKGICCVTIGEAEVMVAGGIPGVLITSPAVTESKIRRLIALARQAGPGGLMIVLDHPENLAALDQAAAALDHPLDVLVDYGAGYNRTGAASHVELLGLALLAADAPHLRLRGLQAYAGNLQHIPERAHRAAAAADLRATIGHLIETARGQGTPFEIVTGAGTGTHDLDPEGHVFTELQAGSYVFMDVDYHHALADGLNGPPFETALLAQTAVVSVNAADWVTTDGGIKCFATDGPLPEVASGVDPASRYQLFGDEHGKLFPVGPRPALGARIELVTPHCDPTVNLHDWYHVMEGDTLVALWPIDGRGRR